MKDLSKLARPLTNLTRKGMIFVWNDKCEVPFGMLKRRLTTAPGLGYTVMIDASLLGLGCVLM